MNKVILMGRLVSDPEVKSTQSGVSVTTIRIAVNRRFAKQGDPITADFFDVVCWRKTAEFVGKYFTKGRKIAVSGSLQTRMWQDKDGNKRYVTEVAADEVYFADSKKNDEADGCGEFTCVADDEELPF